MPVEFVEFVEFQVYVEFIQFESTEDRPSDRQEASSVAGTLTIDTTATFQAVLLMASGPKLKFGSIEQDISARGERKWDVQAAVGCLLLSGLRILIGS